MRLLVGLLLTTQIGLASSWPLQERQIQRDRFFLEPPETVLIVIASQPSCGIEFTKALVIHGVEGGVGHIYQVRNRGPKAVRSYKVAAVTSAGSGSYWSWSYGNKQADTLFRPGELRPKSIDDFGIEIVPLTNALREKHRLHGPVLGIVVFLVVNVVYADGTEFNSSTEYQALKEFFEKNQALSPR